MNGKLALIDEGKKIVIFKKKIKININLKLRKGELCGQNFQVIINR